MSERPASVTASVGAAAAVVVAVLAVVVGLSNAASAHTDLLRGSPGPAQRSGGTVDFIDLVFLESVTEFDLTLEDPNGDLVTGTLNSTEGQLFRFQLDQPITETGRYVVRYTMISADGDDTATGYFFTYEPSAPQPLPLGEVDVPDTGTPVLAVIAAVVFVGCLVGLAFVFLLGLERKRAAAAKRADDTDATTRELAE